MQKKKKMIAHIRGFPLQLEQQMLCLLLLPLLLAAPYVKAGSVGFCYGRFANNLPSPQDVASLLTKKSITKIRIFDNNQDVIQAFANTDIELVIGIPNGNLPDFQVEAQADSWVSSYLAPMATDTKITAIAVGSEVVTYDPASIPFVLPAMKNIHTGLTKASLSQIQVTTANSMAILQDSFPPSSAVFNQSFATSFMKPLLDYLHSIGSFVMINAYPYLAYTVDSARVPLDYALFQAQQVVVDPNTRLQYTSLYDAQLDALYFAMESMGHSELKVVVSESGWPTKGDQGESAATPHNAQTYNNNLIARVVKDAGTPYRPDAPVDAYIFSLFNENMKTGAESERNWGVFNVDGTPIYNLDLEGVNTTISTVSAPSPTTAPQNLNTGSVGGGTWCIAKPGVSNSSLAAGINWACGQGKANCTLIQQGQACYQPNTFQNHASYAYNSYYHDNGGNAASCNFNGTAVTTTTNPSYGSCIFPPSSVSSSLNSKGNSSSTAASQHSTFHWSFRVIPLVVLLMLGSN